MLKKIIGFENQIVALALSRRIWALISGPITIYCLATYLSLNEQGYYYTFESIISLKVFFELGLSFVIMQFVSHETKNIAITKYGIQGSNKSISRIKLISEYSKIKYIKIALLFVLCILPTGIYFFSMSEDNGVNWELPWIITVIVTAFNIYYIPHLSILEGIGKRRSFYIKYLFDGIFGSTLMWILWYFNFGLFAVISSPVASLLTSIIWVFFIEKNFFEFLKGVKILKTDDSLKNDLWNMQKKIAISWIAGYFMTKVFSPLLFHFEGTSVAGLYGLTMVIISNLYIVGISFVNTKSPLFGRLIAQNKISELISSFNKSLFHAILIYIVGSLFLIALLFFLRDYYPEYRDRFLNDFEFSLLLIAILANVIISSLQTVLRAFKDDPLVKLNIINGILNSFGGFISIYIGGVVGLVIWYCLIQVTVAIIVSFYTVNFIKIKSEDVNIRIGVFNEN